MGTLLSSRSERDIILPIMRTYELMVVARGDFPADDDARRQSLAGGLAGEGATAGNITVLGKKRLAYAINKQTEGVYLVVVLNARGILGSDIQKRASVNPDVLRHLLVVKN